MHHPTKYFIAGGAGFIGSHFVDRLLADDTVERVTIFDNFSSGRRWHYEHHLRDDRFHVIQGEITDRVLLNASLEDHNLVIHLASNPDIARAAVDPTIDFEQGTALTNCLVEAMRLTSAKRILYASGSGVYGDLGELEAEETYGPLLPVSTYGASKLAGEAMISAYCHMFGINGCAFRFGNVVGPRQTHGVGFDFIRALQVDHGRLRILGDGTQSKSYVHVDDVVSAVLLASHSSDDPFEIYNVATGDYVTVREIADLAVETLGFNPGSVRYDFTGGDRGWKGDVPIVRLSTKKIRARGWVPALNCRGALQSAMKALHEDARIAI